MVNLMRPYCTFLFFLIFVSIVHAQNGNADPDMLEIERELELIEAELKQKLLESSNEASLPTDKEPETESFESNEMNNPAPGFGVTLDSNDERMKIREELIAIQRELDKLGGQPIRTYYPSDSATEDTELEIEKYNASTDLGVMDEKSIIREELLAIQRELNLLNNGVIETSAESFNEEFVDTDEFLPLGMGGYFLPFFGVSTAETLKWKSLGGDFDLIQNEGHSLGVRLGHSWNIFFLDFQLSYYENEIKKLDLTDGLVFDLFGDVKGLSYHASIGAKMYINTRSFLSFGAGVGASDQSVSFELMEVVQQEDDVLLSYQVFAGLEYHPTDHFRIGLRYRWMLSEGMDLFSSQELHLGELSLGYSH